MCVLCMYMYIKICASTKYHIYLLLYEWNTRQNNNYVTCVIYELRTLKIFAYDYFKTHIDFTIVFT